MIGRSLPRAWTWLFLSFVVLGGACASAVPPVVRSALAEAPPGTKSIVLFTDFQCPYCRRTHAKISSALADTGASAKVVLVHVPLRSHPDARTAARAAICAEALLPSPAAREVVDAMMHATDLSEAACTDLLASRGADRDRVRGCTSSHETEARLVRDRAAFMEAGGGGVPVVYVDRVRIDGEPTTEELYRALGFDRP